MIVADLHVHTTASDGTMTVPEVIDAARAADIDVVAITDHDRLHPALDAPITRLDAENEPVASDGGDPESGGLTVIRGIELRVDAGFESVDLLGYAGRRTDALERELDRLGRDRAERGRRIVECVEARLDVTLDIAVDESVGRPHIARAIEESDAGYDYREAFSRLIGEQGPCYVPRDLPSVAEGAALLAGACEVVSLAHPFRYRNTERALALCGKPAIDAVERYYDYGRAVDEARLDRLIEREGLLATGGSDAHDDVLGRAGLSPSVYEPFERRLSKP